MRSLKLLLVGFLLTASTAWAWGPGMLLLATKPSCSSGTTTTYDFTSSYTDWTNSGSLGTTLDLGLDSGELKSHAYYSSQDPVAVSRITRYSPCGGTLSFKHRQLQLTGASPTYQVGSAAAQALTATLSLAPVTGVSYPAGSVTFIFREQQSTYNDAHLWLDDVVFTDTVQ